MRDAGSRILALVPISRADFPCVAPSRPLAPYRRMPGTLPKAFMRSAKSSGPWEICSFWSNFGRKSTSPRFHRYGSAASTGDGRRVPNGHPPSHFHLRIGSAVSCASSFTSRCPCCWTSAFDVVATVELALLALVLLQQNGRRQSARLLQGDQVDGLLPAPVLPWCS